MATNAGPVYGKQYIRYAETFEAATTGASGPANSVEIGEFRVVKELDTTSNSVLAVQPGDSDNPTGPAILGVNQAYMPSALASPQTARQITVATSGLLLVEVEPASVGLTVGTQLKFNADGQANNLGTAATCNGTTPTIREFLTIGGRRFVLVSFT